MSTPLPHSQRSEFQVACRRTASSALILLLLATIGGCETGLFPMAGQSAIADRFSSLFDADEKENNYRRERSEDNDFGRRYETPLLGEYMSVQGNSLVVLKGVGLVTGLSGQGGDPSPSGLRTQLLNEMSRRKVPQANELLASPDTALVVVIAYLPAMVRKSQPFDVRVVLPPNSNARSLKGGWLLETRLFEEHTVQNTTSLRPQEYAVAAGAILTDLMAEGNRGEKQATLMAGTIPGGAVSRVDRDLSIILRSDKRNARNSDRVAKAVSARFHRHNRFGQKITCATAKSDVLVELKSHPQYINNFPRYQAVIRRIAMNEADVARRMRIEMLARDIVDPDLCEEAALQLEAIGDEAIPYLRDALSADSLEVRFNAAQSLAYLEDASGVEVLKQAVSDHSAFRIYGLVALSVLKNDPDAILALRELMSDKSLETCYGALRSLKELDPSDPFLKRTRFSSGFVLHEIESTGEPMVHVTRRRLPEVVVFGNSQTLRLPCILNAGNNLRVIGRSGGRTVEITRYALNRDPERFTIGNNLSEVIRACGELGATYPEIVQLLVEAENQHNLTGQFGIDRLPQPGRTYRRSSLRDSADESAADSPEREIGAPGLTPQLFDQLDEDELARNESAEKLVNIDFSEVAKSDSDGAAAPKAVTADAAPQNHDLISAADEFQPEEAGDDTSRTESEANPEQPEEAEFEQAPGPTLIERLNPFRRLNRPFDGLTEPE